MATLRLQFQEAVEQRKDPDGARVERFHTLVARPDTELSVEHSLTGSKKDSSKKPEKNRGKACTAGYLYVWQQKNPRKEGMAAVQAG